MHLRFTKENNKHTIKCETLYFTSVVFFVGNEKHAILNLTWDSNEDGKTVKQKQQIDLNGYIDLYAPVTKGIIVLRKDSPKALHKFPNLIGEITISFQNTPNKTDSPDFDVAIEFFTT
ncbi:MAG: hypothetical protein HY951_14335 [Bacteroidia bacterium]|nr:hypothetical protein [Bacteroidia bacterium]